MRKFLKVSAATILVIGVSTTVAWADQVHNDDVIIDGSACVGFDCVNGESFGFDTIRLKENNLRINFEDTSTSASFPSNDWRITINDSSNGGANKFSIDDATGGRTPFTIEAGAPSHSLYVEDGGRVGFGTNQPVADLHVKSGNTPTLRLEQDGSSGFTPQTWDVAANEANIFIRDATNGSTLPFRIRPGAPTSSIDVAADGDVGMGTSSPEANLHIRNTINASGDDTRNFQLVLENASTDESNAGLRFIEKDDGGDPANDNTWALRTIETTKFSISKPGTGVKEFVLDENGNLTIAGDIFTATCIDPAACTPDYVFHPDYNLMPLEQLSAFIEQQGHLPRVPSAKENEKAGRINISDMQMRLLEKVEELTLYTLAQQKTIDGLQTRLAALEMTK